MATCKKVAIIGGGGHARVVADILRAMTGIKPLGYITLDAKPGEVGPLGLPILGDDSVLATLDHDGVVVAVGDNLARKRLYEVLVQAGETVIKAIHPSAIIAPDVLLGAGCMVCPGAILNTGTEVGENSILNTGCVVDHDCRIASHCHVGPGVKLAGAVSLETGVFMGIGASVIQNIVVGERATVGAGAAVIRDIPAEQVAVGVPARW